MKNLTLTVCSCLSHTHFRVNPHSIVAWMSRNPLLKADGHLNLTLVCLERGLSIWNCWKKGLQPSFLSLSQVIGVQNAISFKKIKKYVFSSIFSIAYHFLIDFSKIFQFMNILRNWEHGIEHISQKWWSNFHKILILHSKLHKKVKKMP